MPQTEILIDHRHTLLAVLLCSAHKSLRDAALVHIIVIRQILRFKERFHPKYIKTVHRVVADLESCAGRVQERTVQYIILSLFRDETGIAGENVYYSSRFLFLRIHGIAQKAGIVAALRN